MASKFITYSCFAQLENNDKKYQHSNTPPTLGDIAEPSLNENFYFNIDTSHHFRFVQTTTFPYNPP
jgi:hypothetical protein